MKTALVTGASGGIGKSFVQKLAAAGYQITGVSRSESQLKEVFGPLGKNHTFIVADLSTQAGQEAIKKLVNGQKFNLVVNNAGVGTIGLFADVDLEKQMAMLRLNVDALTQISHAFLKHAKSGDALINVSSALAFMPTPTMALYAATKAFVTSLSEALWFEYKSKGVYVMGLCPGMTETNFQAAAGGESKELPKNLIQTADEVVDNALTALAAREKPTIVSGYKNVLFTGMSRILPRKSLIEMTGKFTAKKH